MFYLKFGERVEGKGGGGGGGGGQITIEKTEWILKVLLSSSIQNKELIEHNFSF